MCHHFKFKFLSFLIQRMPKNGLRTVSVALFSFFMRDFRAAHYKLLHNPWRRRSQVFHHDCPWRRLFWPGVGFGPPVEQNLHRVARRSLEFWICHVVQARAGVTPMRQEHLVKHRIRIVWIWRFVLSTFTEPIARTEQARGRLVSKAISPK